ncbi:hypothetical protein Xcel_0050 [Xylanimonas cellulosilytica DSM 15894]|uniref:Uncharacterized protein n=1 Tax=Xylanimonas cellulosilytica (strain DSM 15894 / JCM 12276 / CECT 5975 / KCTC 9989 / LMG 20990 / NBRC 107835 / XIL07) TaxID=446471 RepID=D1BTE9_XYLCX|nr:hypothetical protein [Xylanimonas cellulosilytica]ACZ29091.1 hypothetical protein Xcel_0050 [Xylanimonas cellulosilytica DSM 15894]
MSEFQVTRRVKPEPTAAVVGRVLLSFVLFLGGLVLLGAGASDASSTPWLWFGLGLLAVALSFGLPMRGASQR